MSKKKQKKKSTNKYQSSGFLIPIIAILETIVLVAVSSFAWFFYSANKSMSSAIITVNADSGLEIDFRDADKSSYIDVWDYIKEDEFMFEPATSTDGRNIYFPTSGTFGSTDTKTMTFREGTANDVNSKYISIDFTLTNTKGDPVLTNNATPALNNKTYNEMTAEEKSLLTEEETEYLLHGNDMEVFLSNNSRFTLLNNTNNSNLSGKALRLAFYNNDGKTGKVDSGFSANHSSDADASSTQSSAAENPDNFTLYFYKPASGWGDNIRAYVYDSFDVTAEGNAGYSRSTDLQAWPGVKCSHVSGDLFSVSFSNPYKTKTVVDEYDGTQTVYTHPSSRLYDKIIFCDGGSKQTENLTIVNGHGYNENSGKGGDSAEGFAITLQTVYFLKPTGWHTPIFDIYDTNSGNHAFSNGGNDTNTNVDAACTEVAKGIYSYTFPLMYDGTHTYNKMKIKDDNGNTSLATDISDGDMYYFPNRTVVPSAPLATLYKTKYSESSIFLSTNNKEGWDQPYAYINAFASAGDYTYRFPMINISSGLYYCTVPDIYLKDVMSARDDAVGSTTITASGLADNCVVYFTNTTGTPANNQKTVTYDCLSKYIYTFDESSSAEPYVLTRQDYGSDLSITDDSYAVISPGVSAGFQKSAYPVYDLTAAGKAATILPAFASSIDDFIMGSEHPVFTVAAGHTVNMSMIIWLEGTDDDCTAAYYAGNNIELYLEFSTIVSDSVDTSTYIYQFLDKTEELWTANSITNTATQVTVNPVMQLFDVDADRGYIMSRETYSYSDYEDDEEYTKGNKVSVWQCMAPRTLLTNGHKIEFRRVNPYKESQIWNRWQAGVLSTYKDYAFDAKTNTVSFTAFADGSPDYDTYHSTSGFENIPALSCGGLWGNIETDMMYVYDGRKYKNITDSYGSNDKGVLMIRYEYYYSADKHVKIEYKASVHHTNFYSFVVPANVYEDRTGIGRPSVTFCNYAIKNGYAINAAEQTEIHHRADFNADTVRGHFYELNGDSDGDNNMNNCFWGSDVIYIQGGRMSYSYSSNDSRMQVLFNGSGTDYYVYLYDDTNYNGGSNYGFVSVVPNNVSYTSYYVQRMIDGTKTREASGASCISTISAASSSDGLLYNYITNGKRLRYLEYDYKIIYFHEAGFGSPYYHLKCYNSYDNSMLHGGDDISQTADGHPVFRYHVRSDANVYFSKDALNTNDKTKSIEPGDGCCYYPDGYDDSDHRATLGIQNQKHYGYWQTGNHNTNQTVVSHDDYCSSDWPAYTEKSTGPSGS